jgi:hypothetical protein
MIEQGSEPLTRHGRTAGILAGISYIFLLSFSMIDQGIDRQLMMLAIVGIIASGAVIAVDLLVVGWIRKVVFTFLGATLVVLPTFFVSGRLYENFLQIIYFIQGGPVGIMGFALLITLFGISGVAECDKRPDSVSIRWVTGSLAVIGMIMQGVYGLTLLARSTDWSRQLPQFLHSCGTISLIAFVWVTIAVWFVLLITLLAAKSVKVRIANSVFLFSVVRIVMWSVIGFVLLAALNQLVGPGTSDRATTDVGRTLLVFFVVAIPVLLPFLAGAYLCVEFFGDALVSALSELEDLQSERADSLALKKQPYQESTVLRQPKGAVVDHQETTPTRTYSTSIKQEAPACVPHSKSEMDVVTALRKLKELKDQDLISQIEFDEKKAQLLDRV